MRVAFFGGSFDPPHRGHLGVAWAARAALGLDRVLFAPVGGQPLKPEGSTASFDDRVAMTRLAIAGSPGFEVSLADAPSSTGRPNFTADTLERLRAELDPGTELYCLMGADSFRLLAQWRRAAEIPFLAELIVVSRPGEQLNDLTTALPASLLLDPASAIACEVSGVRRRTLTLTGPAGRQTRLNLLPEVELDVSATRIRQLLNSHAGAADLLSPAVFRYIRERELYR